MSTVEFSTNMNEIHRAAALKQKEQALGSMNKERIDLWLHELEFGDDEQCYGYLATSEPTRDKRGRFSTKLQFCAVGVAIKVYCRENGLRMPIDHDGAGSLDREAARWYGVPTLDLIVSGDSPQGAPFRSVIGLNDGEHLTFSEIAQQVRKDYF
jgi:hypothetical protein